MRSSYFFIIGENVFGVKKEAFLKELQTNKYLDDKGNCFVETKSFYEMGSGILVTNYYLRVLS